jgi:sirohydrochlorin ferrochelatase
MTDLYTVFVGGMEVTMLYVTKDKAEEVTEEYKSDGYDDIAIIPMTAIETMHFTISR